MEWVTVRPGLGWLAGQRPFVRLLADAAAAAGGELSLERRFGHLGRFVAADGTSRVLFGNALGVNGDSAAALVGDKDYTARLLRGAGMPAPEGLLVFGPHYAAAMALKNTAVAAGLPDAAAAELWAAARGWPVIVKPNTGSQGRGIARAESAAALRQDLERLFATDQMVRVETFCPGTDYRVVVWEGAVRLAYRRDPAMVTGDGVRSLGALIAALREGLSASARGPKLDAESPAVTRQLAAQGLDLASVPEMGRQVAVVPNANASTGGRCTDLTGQIAPEAEALAVRAARLCGLRLAGVDLLAPDLTRGIDGATVIEVNAAPGLDGYAHAGPQAWGRAVALLRDILRAPPVAGAGAVG